MFNLSVAAKTFKVCSIWFMSSKIKAGTKVNSSKEAIIMASVKDPTWKEPNSKPMLKSKVFKYAK